MPHPTISTGPSRKADAAVGLPLSWYFDPEILEIERQHLFARWADVRGAHLARAERRRLFHARRPADGQSCWCGTTGGPS